MDDSKLPAEDKPQVAPSDIPEIQAQEGVKSADSEDRDLNNPSEQATSSPSESETGGGGEKSLDSQSLAQKEKQPQTNFSFNPVSAKGPSSFTNFFWGSKMRKRASTGGVIISLLFGGGLIGLSSVSGAAELVQVSHVLQTDMKSVTKISSSRNNNLLRYSDANDVGETRLGVLGTKYFRSTLTDLQDSGITFDNNSLSNLNGATIDMDQLETKYPELKDSTTLEKREWLQNKFSNSGTDLPIDKFNAQEVGGKLKINIDLRDTSDFNVLGSFTKSTLSLLGRGDIETGLMARIFTDYLDIPSLFHPLERQVNAKARAAANIADSKQEEEQAQEAEDTNVNADAQASVDDVNNEEGKFNNPAMKLLLFTGGACFVRSIAKDVVTINRDRIVLPSVIQALNFISVGEQVQSGQDVDANQLNAIETSLDSKNGTIFGGTALQATEGNSTQVGTDLPLSEKQAFNVNTTEGNVSSWATGALGGSLPASIACSNVGLLVQALASVGLAAADAFGEAVTDGALTPATLAIWSAKEGINFGVSALVMNFVEHFVLNKSTDGELAKDAFSGPTGGDLLAYGARESANIVARSSGGIALSNSASQTLSYDAQQQSQQQFESEPLFARLFDIYDYRSLLGKLADSISPNLINNFSDLLNGFQGIGHNLMSNLSSMFTPGTLAASKPYNWGFPIYSIPNAVLNDPNLADPYGNATQVEALLTNNTVDPLGVSGNTYQQRAETCFGITLSNSSGSWDLTPGTAPNPNDTPYINSDCADYKNDFNWERMMIYVADMRTMDADACYAGDDQACSDLGYTSQSNTTSSSSGTGTSSSGVLPSGTSQQLAQDILNNKKIALIGTDVQLDLEDTVKGQPASAGKPLSNTLLSLIDYMGQNHTFNITALESGGTGHSGPGDPHYEGDAVDITGLDGDPIANSGIGRTVHDQALITEIAPLMPTSTADDFFHWSGFGQKECGTTPPLPNGIVTFDDTCSHLHIQVPVGTP